MLFPHQIVPHDSLSLPSYCTRDGHPTPKPERWYTLGDHSEAFETVDIVAFYPMISSSQTEFHSVTDAESGFHNLCTATIAWGISLSLSGIQANRQ